MTPGLPSALMLLVCAVVDAYTPSEIRHEPASCGTVCCQCRTAAAPSEAPRNSRIGFTPVVATGPNTICPFPDLALDSAPATMYGRGGKYT
jgi:hypothetical protein